MKTFKDYFRLASVTMAQDTKEKMLEHAVQGLFTEAGETIDIIKRHRHYKDKVTGLPKPFDVVGLLEELGDSAWYCHIAPMLFANTEDWDTDTLISEAYDIAIPYSTHYPYAITSPMFSIAGAATDCIPSDLDMVIPDAHHMALSCYAMRQIMSVLKYLQVDPLDVFSANIAKLAKRYPKEQFDLLPAHIRELSVERDVLVKFLDKYTEPVRKIIDAS